MPARRDQAVVLRLSDYSESSQVVTLFSAAHGLVRLIAKGVRRSTRTRVAPGLDLLELGELGFLPPTGEAGLGTLTDWMQRDAFDGLRRDALRLQAGLYAAELVMNLTAELDPHAELFAALVELLRGLAQRESPLAAKPPPASIRGAEDPAAALLRFQTALLRAIGYAPNLERCCVCGKARMRGAPAYFSSTAGGLVCRDCEPQQVEKRRVSPRLIDAGDDPQLRAEWFDLLNYHLTHMAGKRFRTAERLHKLLRQRASPPAAASGRAIGLGSGRPPPATPAG